MNEQDDKQMQLGLRILQSRVKNWFGETFGIPIEITRRAYARLLLENAIALARLMGIDFDEERRIADRVYSQPLTKPEQEAALVALSLAACAVESGIDLGYMVSSEISRLQDPAVRQRCRQNHLQQQSWGMTAADAPAAAPAVPVTAKLLEKPSRRIEAISRQKAGMFRSNEPQVDPRVIVQYLDELHAANQLLSRPADRDPSLVAPTTENAGVPPQVPGMNDVDLLCHFWFFTRGPFSTSFFSRAQIRRLYWLAGASVTDAEVDNLVFTRAEVDLLLTHAQRRLADALDRNKETRGT